MPCHKNYILFYKNRCWYEEYSKSEGHWFIFEFCCAWRQLQIWFKTKIFLHKTAMRNCNLNKFYINVLFKGAVWELTLYRRRIILDDITVRLVFHSPLQLFNQEDDSRFLRSKSWIFLVDTAVWRRTLWCSKIKADVNFLCHRFWIPYFSFAVNLRYRLHIWHEKRL